MYKIDASKYHEAIAILHNVISLVRHKQPSVHDVMPTGARNSSKIQLTTLGSLADDLQCRVTSLGIQSATQTLLHDADLTYFGCGQLLNAISHNFRNELSLRLIYAIDCKKGDYFEQRTPLFGLSVNANFPDLAYDIDQAGKCYACELDTASAFHSLRCLEAAIRAIARCLGVPDPTKAKDRNWGEALKFIKAEIDKRWPNAAAKMSGDGKEFDEIYGALHAIQNPYRNSTMHLDKKYTSADALYLLEMVKGLLTRVALRMDQHGNPRLEPLRA